MNQDFFNDDAEVNVECPSCLESVPATFRSLEKNSKITCGDCGFRFNYDIEEMKQRVNAAMRKIIGNQPKDPNLN